MTPKERVIAAINHSSTDRPLFCPAIYEHKAKLINSSPSSVAQNVTILAEAVFAEYETYHPDMLTAGIDIYNIEPEALGCNVQFNNAINAAPVINQKILSCVEDIKKLPPIDPQKSGRMPLMLDAAELVQKKLGNDVFVRGPVSGPFSMAAELLGIEQLLMATILQPDDVETLLHFCTDVAVDYGKAFLARGVEVCVFDSQTSPPLISPAMYEQMILPHNRRLVASLQNAGATFIEYVVGGDTSANAKNLFSTEADILLSDFASDIEVFLPRAKIDGRLVRRNISPMLIENGNEIELSKEANRIIQLAKANPQIIIGTGVLSYDTPIERLLLVKSLLI